MQLSNCSKHHANSEVWEVFPKQVLSSLLLLFLLLFSWDARKSEHVLSRGTQHPLSFALEILKMRKEGIAPATGLEDSA